MQKFRHILWVGCVLLGTLFTQVAQPFWHTHGNEVHANVHSFDGHEASLTDAGDHFCPGCQFHFNAVGLVLFPLVLVFVLGQGSSFLIQHFSTLSTFSLSPRGRAPPVLV